LEQDIYIAYLNKIMSSRSKYIADYGDITEKMMRSNAKYKGKIVDFLYQPMFFDQQDIKTFKYISLMLTDIIKKCTYQYLKDPSFRQYFGYSEIMEDLILTDPNYNNPVPIARFDLFYDGNFKLCELNGDGTSAMNEANTLEQIFSESRIIAELRKNYDISYYELFLSWLEVLLEIYREFGGSGRPVIAIADFLGLGSNEEFDTFKSIFEEQGYKTMICDPRDMLYKNGKLYVEDVQIDLVYRRAVNREVELRIDEVRDLIQAYKDNAVCVVGPLRSQIMHNKIFFEILCDEKKTSFLNSTEREFIKKHIPETFSLNENALQKVIGNKDKYIIKPKDLYAGKGVVCGLDCDNEKWGREVQEALDKGGFLIQEFCNFTRMKLPVVQNNDFEFTEFKTTLGLFVYNGKFSGLYSRVGRKNIIAGIEESITLPSFVYTKRS